MRWFALFMLILAGSISGCDKKSAPEPVPVATNSLETTHHYPEKAQGHLQTVRLWLGSEELITEMALTPIQEETGMMYRTNMPENSAMIFVFEGPFRASFWMKNTVLPLSAGYIDPDGTLKEIYDLQPQDTNAVVAKEPDIQYVLEVNQGWFKRHHIEPGTLVRTEFGTLRETFFNHKR